ncbi:hypothetical protein Tco_0385735 [Tanacetum coccineum]
MSTSLPQSQYIIDLGRVSERLVFDAPGERESKARGKDLRGNIKLSSKAASPQKTKKSNAVKESSGLSKQEPDSCATDKKLPNQQENESYTVKDSSEDTDSSTKLNPSHPLTGYVTCVMGSLTNLYRQE